MLGSRNRRWATGAPLVAVAIACLLACSAPDDPGLETRATTMAGVTDPIQPSPTASAPSSATNGGSRLPKHAGPAPAERITMAFGGDVHFEGATKTLLGDSAPLTKALRKTVGAADFAVVNLETAMGTGGTPMPGKQFTFRAPPQALEVLSDAGFDAVSMANNHAADYGPEVFAQTLASRADSPIPIVGVGKNLAEAFTPLRVDVHGVQVAVLGSSQVRDLTGLYHAASPTQAGIAANLDDTALRNAVRDAAESSDVVVVVMHWGTERTSCADDRQRETARRLVADGADIVVGGHGHRPQGSGWHDDAYVAYGLGNFVWYNNNGPSAESGVLTLSIDADYARTTTHATQPEGRKPRQRSVVELASWTPMLIGADGVPRTQVGTAAATSSRAWKTSSICGGLSPQPTS